MSYKYGASLNCLITNKYFLDFTVGAGDEQESSMDFISNDLSKLIDKCIIETEGVLCPNHFLIGKLTEQEREVVGVIVNDLEDISDVLCVIVEYPVWPTPQVVL